MQPSMSAMLIPPETSETSSSSTSSASSRSFLGMSCMFPPSSMGGRDALPRLRGSDGLGRAGNSSGKARGLADGGRLYLRHTVGELVEHGGQRNAAGDAQYFLDAEFLHVVLPLERGALDPAGLASRPDR